MLTLGFGGSTGIYVSDQLVKAMQYAVRAKDGGCILELVVDIGNCLHLDQSTLHMKERWQAAGYDSAHAAEGVLGSGSKEEYCVHDPRRIRQLKHVTLCDAGTATAAGFKTGTGSAGPPGRKNPGNPRFPHGPMHLTSPFDHVMGLMGSRWVF